MAEDDPLNMTHSVTFTATVTLATDTSQCFAPCSPSRASYAEPPPKKKPKKGNMNKFTGSQDRLKPWKRS